MTTTITVEQEDFTTVEALFEGVVEAALNTGRRENVWFEEIIPAAWAIPGVPSNWAIKVWAAHDHEWSIQGIAVLIEDGQAFPEVVWQTTGNLSWDDCFEVHLKTFERYAEIFTQLLAETHERVSREVADKVREALR